MLGGTRHRRKRVGACAAGDGWLDLYVANDGQPNALYRNNGPLGGFTKVTEGDVVTDDGDSHSAAWGDFDGPLRQRKLCGALAARARSVR